MSERNEPRPPWIIRTYAGFGGAEESNARFLTNLRNGQTGLSVAFDLPTQNGYDPDAVRARGGIGGCGVSVAHIGDMEKLFRGISLDEVNTSMTINATAPIILALYLIVAESHGIAWNKLRGTVQNDLLKEFVARGTSIFNPEASLRLSTDVITFTAERVPQWNPINVCGYHYMESGARPHEEIGYAIGNALLILDAVRSTLTPPQFETVLRRISFFINSGIELIPEICKMRAYVKLWRDLCEQIYGIRDVTFRSGCQVRSVSLTAEQPENNIVRIALQALPVILSANARVNALQLPGFREALNLPDQMEQTLSIRTQQILQHETKIADYPDIFEGNPVISELTARTVDQARALALELRAAGYESTISCIDQQLTEAMLERQQRIDRKEEIVVGMNEFLDPVGMSEQLSPAPPTAQDASFEQRRAHELSNWRKDRNERRWRDACEGLREAFSKGDNIMPATIEFGKAGGTVGEWSSIIEDQTGGRHTMKLSLRGTPRSPHNHTTLDRTLRIVLGKTGLDGHNNGLKILAMACRDAGMEVIYAGTKLSPEHLIRTAIEEDADALAISSLSGAHMHIAREIAALRKQHGLTRPKFILGGIIPESDRMSLRKLGVDLVVSNSSGTIADIIEQVKATASS